MVHSVQNFKKIQKNSNLFEIYFGISHIFTVNDLFKQTSIIINLLINKSNKKNT